MRNLIFLLLALCGLPNPGMAGAVNYTINFVTTSGPAPTDGSFTYDAATGFSNFQVAWHGTEFDLTPSANSPDSPFQAPASGCDSSGPDAAYGFIMMTESATGCSATYQWEATTDGHIGLHFLDFRFKLMVASIPATDFISGDVLDLSPVFHSDNAQGTWSITETSAPEPGTLGIMLLAAAATFATTRRKRSQ